LITNKPETFRTVLNPVWERIESR